MCGRYYIEDDTAREIEKVIRWVDQKLRARGQNPRNEDKENVEAGDRQAGDRKAGDIYPAALAPVLGPGDGTAGYRTLDCRMLRWGLPGYTPKGSGKKEKYRFRRTDSPVLFMAGCFQRYEDGDRFVILTTAANASMEPVHDRMPLTLEPEEIAAWIWDGERTQSLLEKQPCLLERTTDYEQMTLF